VSGIQNKAGQHTVGEPHPMHAAQQKKNELMILVMGNPGFMKCNRFSHDLGKLKSQNMLVVVM
jgi:hypothetical protein